MRRSVLALLFFSLASLASAQANWSYQGKTGPVYWSKISPDYSACSKGQQQSPIDIRNARLNTALQPLQFHFLAGPVTVTNTGNTIEVHVDPGSFMVADGVRYELLSFEFHNPSEYTVHNKLSDMEVDMEFRGADGKEADLAIRLNEDDGFPSATLATLWQHLPARPGQSQKITEMVNPGGLLPADRGYWTYMGSELKPPCTEGVRWFVFEQSISISRSQYNAFAALYKRNTRPTQDLHGRKIEANE